MTSAISEKTPASDLNEIRLQPGLENVYLSETRLSRVDGEHGELILAGYPVEEIAPRASFEEMVWLLWTGQLPDAAQLTQLHEALATRRELPAPTLELLRQASQQSELTPMQALRMTAASLDLDSDKTADRPSVADPRFEEEALRIIARLPVLVATHARLCRGEKPLAPRHDLSHAVNFLYLLHGTEPDPAAARALDTYLNTVIDHGANASTFTARVIISTGSDLLSAVVGAIGALKGPLHGGAPGPALDMVFEIGEETRAEGFLRAKLENGERLMGFGHRVYKVRDPRAAVLSHAAARLFEDGTADRQVFDLARHVESVATELLDEYKPGRNLRTNVEFYTALLLHGLGLETALFTPVFAMSRAAGWIAHCAEQRHLGRLIRPRLVYRGAVHERFISLEGRKSQSAGGN